MAKKKVEIEVDVEGNIVESISNLKKLKQSLKEVPAGTAEWNKIKNNIRDIEDSLESAGQSSEDFKGLLESAPGPLGVLGGAIKKVELATKSFGAAFKAIGIGIIVSLLAGMASAFSQNEDAMKKLQPLMIGLQKILGGIFKAVEPLLDIFIDLALQALPYVTKGIGILYSTISGFFSLIKNGGGAIAKILQGIFTLDFGLAKEGLNDYVDSFGKAFDAASETYSAFEEGTKELTATEKEQAEERAKNAADAAAKRKEQSDKELAQRKADLDAKIKLETDAENTSREKLKELLDARLALELKQANLSEAQKEALRQDSAKKLEEALKVDDDKRKADEEKRKVEEEKKLQARARELDALIQLETDKQNTSREELKVLLDERMNIELQNVELTEAQKQVIRAKYAKQLEEAVKNDNDKLEQIRQQAFDTEVAGIESHYGQLKRFNEDYYIALRESYDKNDAELKSALEKGIISQDEYTKKLAILGKARRDIDELEKTSAIEKTKLVADALGQLSTIVGEDTVAGKSFAIAKATIDTYQSAVAAYKSLAAIPVVGPVLGGIAAAAAIATGIATVKKIVAVQVPNAPGGGGGGGAISGGGGGGASAPTSASGPMGAAGPIMVKSTGIRRAQGGIIRGPGSGFSDSIPALLSDGEFVVNSRSTRIFQPLLNSINEAGNLPQFAAGGNVNKSKMPSQDNTEKIVKVIGDTFSQQPIRTYVSSSEISNTQQFDRVLKTRSLI